MNRVIVHTRNADLSHGTDASIDFHQQNIHQLNSQSLWCDMDEQTYQPCPNREQQLSRNLPANYNDRLTDNLYNSYNRLPMKCKSLTSSRVGVEFHDSPRFENEPTTLILPNEMSGNRGIQCVRQGDIANLHSEKEPSQTFADADEVRVNQSPEFCPDLFHVDGSPIHAIHEVTAVREGNISDKRFGAILSDQLMSCELSQHVSTFGEELNSYNSILRSGDFGRLRVIDRKKGDTLLAEIGEVGSGSFEDTTTKDFMPKSTRSINYVNKINGNMPLIKCLKCKKMIRERHLVLLNDGRFLHEDCLSCEVCMSDMRFSSDTDRRSVYLRNDRIYCKKDYLQTFGSETTRELPFCMKCRVQLEKDNWVRRADNYLFHMTCFCCSKCSRQLSRWEQFVMKEQSLICEKHFYDNDPTHTGDNTKPRTKRMRTSFSDDQVKVLQQHFAVDSNPDGQDLERIAKLTGLKKRVTQVWFQNNRARHKKNLHHTGVINTSAVGNAGHDPSSLIPAFSSAAMFVSSNGSEEGNSLNAKEFRDMFPSSNSDSYCDDVEKNGRDANCSNNSAEFFYPKSIW